jgi:hypothetical protein
VRSGRSMMLQRRSLLQVHSKRRPVSGIGRGFCQQVATVTHATRQKEGVGRTQLGPWIAGERLVGGCSIDEKFRRKKDQAGRRS